MRRAAANSRASGRPSRRTQMAATAAAFVGVSAKSGVTACARASKRATASFCASTAGMGNVVRLGSASGGTGTSCSP